MVPGISDILAGVQELPVAGSQLFGAGFPREGGSREAGGNLSAPAAFVGVGQGGPQGAGEGGGIVAADPAGLGGLDLVAERDMAAHDDRQSGRQRLGGGDPEILRCAWQDEEIGSGQELRFRVAGEKSRERDPVAEAVLPDK